MQYFGKDASVGSYPLGREREFDASRRLNLDGASAAVRRLAALRAVRPGVFDSDATSPVIPGASNWLQLGPSAIPNGQTYGGDRVLVSGRVVGIVLHPTDASVLYLAAARGGVWKSVDGGESWLPMSDNEASLALGALAIAPSEPETLYAGTGEGNILALRVYDLLNSINATYQGVGVLKSVDGGGSWANTGETELAGAACFRIAVHPTNAEFALVATSAGLYRTTDGGGAWGLLGNGLPVIAGEVIAATDVILEPGEPEVAYVAFEADTVYRTGDLGSANPKWEAVTGLPAGSTLSRISLAISPSAPERVFAALAESGVVSGLLGVYESGATHAAPWTQATLTGTAINTYSTYTGCLLADPTSDEVLYLSGVSLYKLQRSAPGSSSWTVSDIGESFHPDNHCIAILPGDHETVYAGSDGGIYVSKDAGGSWSDAINQQLGITQQEFIDHHPTSDAVVFGGTQDNGVDQFRNSPVLAHAQDGDAGEVAVDPVTPTNVIGSYYGANFTRSTEGGAFGTFSSIAAPLGSSLFYPPLAVDESSPQTIACGGDEVLLSSTQGTAGWPTQIALLGLAGLVSAMQFVTSDLIYAATTAGEVYRLTYTAGAWTATAIQAAPLPDAWIWGIAASAASPTVVTVALAGFGTPHMWQGTVGAGGTTWANISGSGSGELPDVPFNSLALDPNDANTIYAGSDIGVFRSLDNGTSWEPFNDGLPNTAVYSLKLHQPTRLLRAATHGRGIWERQLDVTSMPDVNLFVRDHLMDTGRRTPPTYGQPAAFADPLQHVALGDPLFFWQCADIKIDAPYGTPPGYQLPVPDVEFIAFESKLEHLDPVRGEVNHVYAQVHNRGVQPASAVTVKVIYADATTNVPDLPPDFWTAFPGDSADPLNPWISIGPAQTIPSISPTVPAVLEWDWTPPTTTAEHSCMLMIVESPDDPIPAANKVFDIATLVTSEPHVGQKNLHVVNAPPGPAPLIIPFRIRPETAKDVIRIIPTRLTGWKLALLVPADIARTLKIEHFTLREANVEHRRAIAQQIQDEDLDGAPLLHLQPGAAEGRLEGFEIREQGARVPFHLVVFPSRSAQQALVNVVHEQGERILGGNTFVINPHAAAARTKGGQA